MIIHIHPQTENHKQKSKTEKFAYFKYNYFLTTFSKSLHFADVN